MTLTPPVVGGTYQLLLLATRNGAPWDISGATLSLVLTPPPASGLPALTVAPSVILASAVPSPPAWLATLLASYTTVGSYTTLTTDLSVPGPWTASWEVTLGGVVAPFAGDAFTVLAWKPRIDS